MDIFELPIAELVFDPANARKHDNKNLDAIKGSLARFGQQKPIVIDAKNVVRAGNGTLEAARALGWDKIKVVRSQLAGSEMTAFALADNRSAELAEWDDDALTQQLLALQDEGFDIGDLGFGDIDIDLGPPAPQGDPDLIPDLPVEPRTKPGDLYQLGRHRLLCGDATNIQHVERLMGGLIAEMVWTDPPYNVNYEGGTGLKIQNDHMENDTFRQFLYDSFVSMATATRPGGAIYIAHADSEGYNFRGASSDAGWLNKQCLVWVKSSLVMGRQDYQWKHEPILYGWKAGGSHKWYSDRKQTTVLEFDKPARNDVHPTMKPVELVSYCIENSCRKGDIVLDLFGGSGTTIIASEKTGRRGFSTELDPKYCDVIVDRWEKYTGQEAELLDAEDFEG